MSTSASESVSCQVTKNTSASALRSSRGSLPRAQQIFRLGIEAHLLKQCVCTLDLHLDFSMYKWNPPESAWYDHEGCYCGGTKWVCADCGGQKWYKSMRGAVPCASCQEATTVPVESADAGGKPRTVQAVQIVDALWLDAFRKSVRDI